MQPASWGMENNVGRLIEVRVRSLPDLAEVQRFWQRFGEIAARMQSSQIVICTDVHSILVLPPEVAEAMITGMQRDNPRLLRNGLLLGGSAIALLQVDRLIREANSPARKSFRDPESLIRWLDEILTQPEQQALRRFLGR